MNVRSSLIFDRSYPFFYPSDILCYTVKNERIHEMILSKKISKKITDTLVTNEIIEPQKEGIYFYCLDFSLDLILFNCSLLLIGGLLGLFLPSLVYIIILVPVRMLAGGAHAKSPYSCFLLSYSIYFLTLFLSRLPYLIMPGLYILLISLRFDEFGGIADKSSNFYGLPFDRGFCFFHF